MYPGSLQQGPTCPRHSKGNGNVDQALVFTSFLASLPFLPRMTLQREESVWRRVQAQHRPRHQEQSQWATEFSEATHGCSQVSWEEG